MLFSFDLRARTKNNLHLLTTHVSQPHADEPGHVVAVQVVILYRPHVLPLDKVGHPVAHPARDVGDHGAVPGLQAVERARYGGVASHQPSVVAWPSAVVHGEGLVAGALVEGAQQRHFGRDRDGHVVLDGVEGSEDEVEDADGVAEAFRELLDDDGEAVFLVGWGWLVGWFVGGHGGRDGES